MKNLEVMKRIIGVKDCKLKRELEMVFTGIENDMGVYYFITPQGEEVRIEYDYMEDIIEWEIIEESDRDIEEAYRDLDENEDVLLNKCRSMGREFLYKACKEQKNIFKSYGIRGKNFYLSWDEEYEFIDFENDLIFFNFYMSDYDLNETLVFDMNNLDIIDITDDLSDIGYLDVADYCKKVNVNYAELLGKCIDLMGRVLY